MKKRRKRIRPWADEKLNRFFLSLVTNLEFVRMARISRADMDIPLGGFRNGKQYFEFWNSGKKPKTFRKKLDAEITTLAEVNGVSKNFYPHIEAVLALGSNFRRFKPEYSVLYEYPVHVGRYGAIYGTHKWSSELRILIFAGAAKNSFIDYIRESWPVIEKYLTEKSEYGQLPAKKLKSQKTKELIFKEWRAGNIDIGNGVFKGDTYIKTKRGIVSKSHIQKVIKEFRHSETVFKLLDISEEKFESLGHNIEIRF